MQQHDHTKDAILDSEGVLALAQLLVWFRCHLEEVTECIRQRRPERLAALTQLSLNHPCVVKDLETMDRFLEKMCAIDGRVTYAEHYAATRHNVAEQADQLWAQMSQGSAG